MDKFFWGGGVGKGVGVSPFWILLHFYFQVSEAGSTVIPPPLPPPPCVYMYLRPIFKILLILIILG
jgi:hypothetical protein